MKYREAIEYIIEREGYERGFVTNPFAGDEGAALGLRRTVGLLDRLERPDHRYRIAHVAGTKGKGSTCAMIASIARAGGQRVGLYATPHLHTFRERIVLDGEPVSEEQFASLTASVARAVEQLIRDVPEAGPPTAFEIVTAMALLAFAEVGVDLAVVEVGLGGRLDATNVVTPDVAAISSISIDHAAILGDTLEEIAAEKGGIIKPGRPVVIGPQRPEAEKTLLRIAQERGAAASIAGRDWTAEGPSDAARLTGPWGDWRAVELGLTGAHQVENAGLALMTSWLLHPQLTGQESVAREGLRAVTWPGRFELLASEPSVYVDGAHNVDSMIRLVELLEARTTGGPIAVIFGVARDKDLAGMLAALSRLNVDLIATASRNPRAVDPNEIAVTAMQTGITARVIPDIADALEMARAAVGPDGLVCVTGSLYVVAEAREALGIAETPEFERGLLYR